MSIATDNGSKDGRNHFISKVPLLQPTRDPTVVFNHLKGCAVAFQRDGRGDETKAMDPRGSFVKHMSRDFIQSEDAISPEALASITSKSSADAAVVQNALRFDTDRKKEDNLVRQAEKGLFHPLKATLSSTSLGQVKNLNLAKFEAAEVARDLDYLVKAIIQSHSGKITRRFIQGQSDDKRGKTTVW